MAPADEAAGTCFRDAHREAQAAPFLRLSCNDHDRVMTAMWKRDKTKKSRSEGAPPPDAGPSGVPNESGAAPRTQDPARSDAISPPETDDRSRRGPTRGGEEDAPNQRRT